MEHEEKVPRLSTNDLESLGFQNGFILCLRHAHGHIFQDGW